MSSKYILFRYEVNIFIFSFVTRCPCICDMLYTGTIHFGNCRHRIILSTSSDSSKPSTTRIIFFSGIGATSKYLVREHKSWIYLLLKIWFHFLIRDWMSSSFAGRLRFILSFNWVDTAFIKCDMVLVSFELEIKKYFANTELTSFSFALDVFLEIINWEQ